MAETLSDYRPTYPVSRECAYNEDLLNIFPSHYKNVPVTVKIVPVAQGSEILHTIKKRNRHAGRGPVMLPGLLQVEALTLLLFYWHQLSCKQLLSRE